MSYENVQASNCQENPHSVIFKTSKFSGEPIGFLWGFFAVLFLTNGIRKKWIHTYR